MGRFELDEFGLEGVHAMAEHSLLPPPFLELQLLALFNLVDFLLVGAVLVAVHCLLQHVRCALLNSGQATAVLPGSFALGGPLHGELLLDLFLYFLAGLLDEVLAVGEVLLDEFFVVVLGSHVLLDVVVVEVLPAGGHR